MRDIQSLVKIKGEVYATGIKEYKGCEKGNQKGRKRTWDSVTN